MKGKCIASLKGIHQQRWRQRLHRNQARWKQALQSEVVEQEECSCFDYIKWIDNALE